MNEETLQVRQYGKTNKIIKDLIERNDKLSEQYRYRDIRCVHLENENEYLQYRIKQLENKREISGNNFHSLVKNYRNLQKQNEQLENIRKEAIAFVKNNKDKTIAPYGDNEDTDYEVCLFEDDINDLLNILNKGVDKE